MVAVRGNNSLFVAKEYEENLAIINMKQVNTVDVINPYLFRGKVNKGDAVELLMADKVVWRCEVMTLFTKAKVRLKKLERIEFIKESWQEF